MLKHFGDRTLFRKAYGAMTKSRKQSRITLTTCLPVLPPTDCQSPEGVEHSVAHGLCASLERTLCTRTPWPRKQSATTARTWSSTAGRIASCLVWFASAASSWTYLQIAELPQRPISMMTRRSRSARANSWAPATRKACCAHLCKTWRGQSLRSSHTTWILVGGLGGPLPSPKNGALALHRPFLRRRTEHRSAA